MTVSRYPIVHVVWVDAAIGVGRWEDRQDALTRMDEQWASPIHTAGFLVAREDDRFVVCASDNPGVDDISQCIVIPRATIQQMDMWTGHVDPE